MFVTARHVRHLSLSVLLTLVIAVGMVSIALPVNASPSSGTHQPPVPADPATMATGVHPTFAYSPEECGDLLVENDSTVQTAALKNSCYGMGFTVRSLAFPKKDPNKSPHLYMAHYYHFFSAQELYYCDASGAAMTRRPQDTGKYHLCINAYGSRNIQNGVNMYRKLEAPASHPSWENTAWEKWIKVNDNDETHFWDFNGKELVYNILTPDLTGVKLPKVWTILQNPVTATLTGTSVVPFVADTALSLDVAQYTLSLTVNDSIVNSRLRPFLATPAQSLEATLPLKPGDLEPVPVNTTTNPGTDITSAGDTSSLNLGTMTGGYTANKRYAVQLSDQGKRHLNGYLAAVFKRSDNQPVSQTVQANYALTSNNAATITVLAPVSLNYDPNATDATGTVSSSTSLAGNPIAVTREQYARTGYTFTGWNTKADGTGTAYSTGGSLTITSPTKSVTLYAQWSAHHYTVQFDKNSTDVTGTMTDQTFEYGASQRLTANRFIRTGYIFTGWNTKADGTGTSYADQQEVTNLTSNADGTVTLYAQWAPEISRASLPKTGAHKGRSVQAITRAISRASLPKTGAAGIILIAAAIVLLFAGAFLLISLHRRKAIANC